MCPSRYAPPWRRDHGQQRAAPIPVSRTAARRIWGARRGTGTAQVYFLDHIFTFLRRRRLHRGSVPVTVSNTHGALAMPAKSLARPDRYFRPPALHVQLRSVASANGRLRTNNRLRSVVEESLPFGPLEARITGSSVAVGCTPGVVGPLRGGSGHDQGQSVSCSVHQDRQRDSSSARWVSSR